MRFDLHTIIVFFFLPSKFVDLPANLDSWRFSSKTVVFVGVGRMSRPPRITGQQVEHNVQQQRILDVQRHQLSLFAAENNKLLSEARAQAKVEIRRRQAEQDSCRPEME